MFFITKRKNHYPGHPGDAPGIPRDPRGGNRGTLGHLGAKIPAGTRFGDALSEEIG